MLPAGFLALITSASALEVIFTGVCAIQQAKPNTPFRLVCPNGIEPRPSDHIRNAAIGSHHAFVRVEDGALHKSSGRPVSFRFYHEKWVGPARKGSPEAKARSAVQYAAFLTDGEILEIEDEGMTDTGLVLRDDVIYMSSVCSAKKIKKKYFDELEKSRPALRFDWRRAVSLGSRSKTGEDWRFEPRLEGSLQVKKPGPLAQEVYFRLNPKNALVQIQGKVIEGGKAQPPITIDTSKGDVKVWIGNAALEDILMMPPHGETADIHFELLYDLVDETKHSGELHIPHRVGKRNDREMHGSNCPPVIFGD